MLCAVQVAMNSDVCVCVCVQVMMVSALQNSGIEAMWDTVQDYRTTMEVSIIM